MSMEDNKRSNGESLAVYQKRMLETLVYIDGICRKNDIKYFLAYGTLIGAVRHHGFIPWDDDADICLPRKDYNRLVKAIIEDNDERFKMKCFENSPEWYLGIGRVVDTSTKISLPFSKTQKEFHVFVDVMPLDGQPEGKLTCKIHYFLMNVYKGMAYSADHAYIDPTEKHVKMKKLLRPIASIFGARYWGLKSDKLAQKRPYETSKYVQYGHANKKEAEVTKDVYASAIDCPFETATLMIPVGYDAILKGQYGNYMQLPPEDQRVTGHLFDIIDLGE